MGAGSELPGVDDGGTTVGTGVGRRGDAAWLGVAVGAAVGVRDGTAVQALASTAAVTASAAAARSWIGSDAVLGPRVDGRMARKACHEPRNQPRRGRLARGGIDVRERSASALRAREAAPG